MAQITYNTIKKHRYSDQELDIERCSRENSLRDELLKKIISKQLNKSVSLKDCLEKKKEFTTGTKQSDISVKTKGLHTNESFKNICSDFSIREALVDCGLSEGEVKLLIDVDHRGKECDEAYFAKLKSIRTKLETRQNNLENDSCEHFSGAVGLNRHEYEEEFKKVSSFKAQQLTPCLVQLKPHSDPSVHPDHPINSLHELETKLFPKSTETAPIEIENVTRKGVKNCLFPKSPEIGPIEIGNVPRIRAKSCLFPEIPETEPTEIENVSRKRSDSCLFPESPETAPIEIENVPRKRLKGCQSIPSVKYFSEKPKTFWDMKETPHILLNKEKDLNQSPQNIDTPASKSNLKLVKGKDDFSKPFVWNVEQSKLIPIANIENNKMTVKQIKSDLKFRNYDPGNPSSTIFIKNLPSKLAPLELVALFGHFDSENVSKIEYRILKGKMDGQAFVKFGSVEIASKALELCNGFIIKGKPIVLEYSKKCP